MKEYKHIVFLCLTTWVLTCNLSGQSPVNTQDMTARQLKNYGRNADRLGDTYTAIDFLEPYCKIRQNDGPLNYRLAELFFISRDYVKAEKQFSRVYKSWPDEYPQALYFQALSLKSQGKYEAAKEVYSKFQRKYKYVKNPPVTLTALKEEITGCDMAPTIINNPQPVKIDHMNSSINGPHIELSPVAVTDSFMLYASLRADSTYYFNREDTLKIPTRQFYSAKLVGNDWIGGKLMEGPVNIQGVETGNGALSKDGKRFYFTRATKNWQGKLICSLFVTHKSGDTWLEPEKLSEKVNDPNYTTTQPTIGYLSKPNLEVIYFISDRPGGRGGLDIWYTIFNIKRNSFSVPKNVGSKINTPGNEMTPFYDNKTHTLYFSSTEHEGLGGYDIYKSLGELRKWFTCRNAGYPINSSYDDLYFTINKSGESGYLVSNRPGGNSFQNPTCCDDIYQYRWTDFIKLSVKGIIYPAEQGKIGKNTDQAQLLAMTKDIKPLAHAVISLYMVDKESKEMIFIDRDTTKEGGAYAFNLLPDHDYKFEMEGSQYFNEQVNISTDGINFSYDIEMPPIWVNILSTEKPIVLKNVYYEFDKSELTDASKKNIDSTLLELMQKATDIIVEVSAHTDSLGNAEYNKKLSQERASNVMNYLIQKGIKKNRLLARGYGAEKPIAPNRKPDGSDNPEGREKNRRTEFFIVGTLSSQSDDIDTEDNENQ